MPQAIHDFVEASNFNKKYIHILVINSGMINSKSLTDTYDVGLLDNQFDTPFAALSAVKPFIIIDEPHKFPTGKRHGKILRNLMLNILFVMVQPLARAIKLSLSSNSRGRIQ